MKTGSRSVVARIDPQRCIGCTRCIEACPFDAIIGAPQRMHTVIADECIGCELCIAPCPVDCIELVNAAQDAAPMRDKAIAARQQRARRNARLAREEWVDAGAIRSDLHALVATAVQRAGQRARPDALTATRTGADAHRPEPADANGSSGCNRSTPA